MPTIESALRDATGRLRIGSTSPRLDAEVLLAAALGKPRSFLYTWPEHALDPSLAQGFEALLMRREAGEPVAYLTGWREFWSLSLQVNRTTLIPRPETELLVDQALERLAGLSGTVVDLGTGSGAVALAIASERPDLAVIATDIETQALTLAAANAKRLGLENLSCRQGDWFAALNGEDLVPMLVSNPPYLAEDDPHLEQGDVRYEPRGALVAGPDGLSAIGQIIAGARNHLLPGGWLLLEHGYNQATAVMALLKNQGFVALSSHWDGEGRPRVTAGRAPG